MPNKKKERKLSKQIAKVVIGKDKDIRDRVRNSALAFLKDPEGLAAKRRAKLLDWNKLGPSVIPDMPQTRPEGSELIEYTPWGYYTLLKQVNDFADLGIESNTQIEFDEAHDIQLYLVNDRNKNDIIKLVGVDRETTQQRMTKLRNPSQDK